MSLSLIAYRTKEEHDVPIVPAKMLREWISTGTGGHGYHCLPMSIASQSGWLLLNPYTFTAVWNGKDSLKGLTVEFEGETTDEKKNFVYSHFGAGVLTFHLPYFFRTSEGYNLHVRGPANEPRDGIQALEGIVETDWANQPFTMNWKFTRPDHPVTFKRGEPFCMISPIKRETIELFETDIRHIESDPQLKADFDHFCNQRLLDYAIIDVAYKKAMERGASYRDYVGHFYMRGETSRGEVKISDHKTKLELDPFRDDWHSNYNMPDDEE